MLAAQRRALLRAQLLLARVAIDQKQRVHARDHRDRCAVLRIHFHRIDELAPRVRPAAHVNQARPAHLIVGLVAVGLQNPVPVFQKFRADRRARGPVENRTPSRRQACRIATNRPDDLRRGRRASAPARWFHRPVNRMRAADPCAWPRPPAEAIRPPASPSRPASRARSPRPLRARAWLPGGTAEGDRSTWPPPFRSPRGRWPVLFPRCAAPSGGIWTPEHFPHERFSRLVTRTNHLAGSTIQHFAEVVADHRVSPPQCVQFASQAITSSTRGRFSGRGLRPGCGLRLRGGAVRTARAAIRLPLPRASRLALARPATPVADRSAFRSAAPGTRCAACAAAPGATESRRPSSGW